MKKLPQVRYYFSRASGLAMMAIWVVQLAQCACSCQNLGRTHHTPAYSQLFDQAMAMDAKGDWQAALRVVSQVYGTEVPVQTFYDTLDRHKLRILAGLSSAAVFATNGQTYTLGELKHYFTEVLLPRPRCLAP